MSLVDIDELLLPYLADHPPLHIVVAAFAGVKVPREPDAAEMARLKQWVGTGRDVHAGFRDPVILDFDRLKAEATEKRSA